MGSLADCISAGVFGRLADAHWNGCFCRLLPAEEGVAANVLTLYLIRLMLAKLILFFLVIFPLHAAVAGRVGAVCDQCQLGAKGFSGTWQGGLHYLKF